MPKLYFTNRGAIWDLCDRCQWDYPDFMLRRDSRDNGLYCIVGLHCFDSPSTEDMKGKGDVGALFQFGGNV